MSFNRISIGDGICQVLRSGSCFTLMYFDKNCLKIDPEITRNRQRARLISGLLGLLGGEVGVLEGGEGRLSAAGHKSQRRVLAECKVNPTANKQ